MAVGPLVGFEYDYDDVNNPLYTKWLHDTRERKKRPMQGVLAERAYSQEGSLPVEECTHGTLLLRSHYSNYAYDDVSNRTGSTDADPFGNVTATSDTYTANDANEYSSITRDTVGQNPTHDAAHNMTSIPVRPGSGTEAGNNVSATAVYDTFGQMANIQAGSNDKHYYIYDALGRRIVAAQISPSPDEIEVGRRLLAHAFRCVILQKSARLAWFVASHPHESRIRAFVSSLGIYDGPMVATEYIFKPDTNEPAEVMAGKTTLSNGYAELERIYVNGPSIDEPLFCAIDFDQDSTSTNINDISECSWDGGLSAICNDHSFYYYCDRMGSIAALGHKADDQKILEFYRYRVYGETIALELLDDGSASGIADDGIEDTPDDLSDNTARRVSSYGNSYTFTARRNDDATGVMYYRARYYNPASGRFGAADPLGPVDTINLFEYTRSAPATFIDSMGLKSGLPKWMEFLTDTFRTRVSVDPTCWKHVTRSASVTASTSLPVPIYAGIVLDLDFSGSGNYQVETCGGKHCEDGNFLSVDFTVGLSFSLGVKYVAQATGTVSLSLGLYVDLCDGGVKATTFRADFSATVMIGMGWFGSEWGVFWSPGDLLDLMGIDRTAAKHYDALNKYDCMDCSKCCNDPSPSVQFSQGKESPSVMEASAHVSALSTE